MKLYEAMLLSASNTWLTSLIIANSVEEAFAISSKEYPTKWVKLIFTKPVLSNYSTDYGDDVTEPCFVGENEWDKKFVPLPDLTYQLFDGEEAEEYYNPEINLDL